MVSAIHMASAIQCFCVEHVFNGYI